MIEKPASADAQDPWKRNLERGQRAVVLLLLDSFTVCGHR